MATAFTPLERGFMDFYILEKNGTKAARLAGYKGDDNVLAVTAHRLLRKPKIKAELDRRFAEHAMSANEVLERLGDIARLDMAEFIDLRGGLPTIDLMKAERYHKLHLLKKFKITKGSNIEIELYDAQAALETLGKHLGLFNTVKIEDWRDQALADLRAGKVTVDQLVEAFGGKDNLADALAGHTLAAELFATRGISVQVGEGAESRE